jgi:hypothetical protein
MEKITEYVRSDQRVSVHAVLVKLDESYDYILEDGLKILRGKERMFRFFKGKWVGEDELNIIKEQEKVIEELKQDLKDAKRQSSNSWSQMLEEQNMRRSFQNLLSEEIVVLKFENKKLKEEVESWKKEFKGLRETLEVQETERLKSE